MSETKFTPGPWWFYRESKGDLLVGPGIFYKDLYDYPGKEDEVIANAHLCAAAPEMFESEEKNLEMMEKLHDFLHELSLSNYYAQRHGSLRTFIGRLACNIERTRKTLKKARGEETEEDEE